MGTFYGHPGAAVLIQHPEEGEQVKIATNSPDKSKYHRVAVPVYIEKRLLDELQAKNRS